MLNDKSIPGGCGEDSSGGRSSAATVTFTMAPCPPYDHDLTSSHITFNRPRYGADVYRDGHYLRLLDLNGCLVLLDSAWNGDREAPVVTVRAYGVDINETDAPTIERVAGWLLGTDQDITPFYRAVSDDSRLAPLRSQFYGLHIPQAHSVFEALISAILGQQVSSAVAGVLRNAIVEAFGARIEHCGETYRAVPSAAAIASASKEDLRALKLSGRKAEYVLGIAQGVASGELDLEELHCRTDEEIVERLCRIRGVGPWTAHWLLVRAFDRADGFPHGDLALQRHVTALVRGEAGTASRMSGDQALEASRRWSPYRSYVTTYLFAAARQGSRVQPGTHKWGPG